MQCISLHNYLLLHLNITKQVNTFSKITLNYPSSSLLLNFMASEMMAAYAETVEFHSIIVIK